MAVPVCLDGAGPASAAVLLGVMIYGISSLKDNGIAGEGGYRKTGGYYQSVRPVCSGG